MENIMIMKNKELKIVGIVSLVYISLFLQEAQAMDESTSEYLARAQLEEMKAERNYNFEMAQQAWKELAPPPPSGSTRDYISEQLKKGFPGFHKIIEADGIGNKEE